MSIDKFTEFNVRVQSPKFADNFGQHLVTSSDLSARTFAIASEIFRGQIRVEHISDFLTTRKGVKRDGRLLENCVEMILVSDIFLERHLISY